MSVLLSEDQYDVLLQDNTDNQLTLERQGLSQEQADLYMKTSKYDLKAVPVGESFTSSKTTISVNFKPEKYSEIGNLKDLKKEDKDVLANALSSSFRESNGYEWYCTDFADYIVFDTRLAYNETRYATIVDGCMVYIIFSNEERPNDEEQREELRRIVDTVEFP